MLQLFINPNNKLSINQYLEHYNSSQSMPQDNPVKQQQHQKQADQFRAIARLDQTQKGPLIVIDQSKLQIKINGVVIQYQKQVMTSNGLQISCNPSGQGQKIDKSKYLIPEDKSIAFDSKYMQNKYCTQLAGALNRSTNSQQQRSNRYHKQISINQCNMEISQYLIKKIPIKNKCFELVFKSIPLSNKKMLFQHDKVFIQIVKHVINLNFKVDIDALCHKQKSTLHARVQSISANNQKQEQTSKTSQNFNENNHVDYKRSQPLLTNFQKSVIKIYFQTKNNIKQKKAFLDRTNILILMFSRQTKLLQYLYQINKEIISDWLIDNSLFIFTQFVPISATTSSNNFSACPSPQQTMLTLLKLIQTILTSIPKTETSYKIIEQYLLKDDKLSLWLQQNLQPLSQSPHLLKLLTLMHRVCQISPTYMHTLYCSTHKKLDKMLQKCIQSLYQNYYLFFKEEAEKVMAIKQGEQMLDMLMDICRVMVKEDNQYNLGRTICRAVCQHAGKLRHTDIQMFTYVCCVSEPARAHVVRYLFAYFRKFIKGVRGSLKGAKNKIIKIIKENKHYLIQIIQSIRRISQIDQIEVSIDQNLLKDIKQIIQLGKMRPECSKQSSLHNTKHWKNNCLTSAYESMIKNIQIFKFKQAQTHDQESQSRNRRM